MKHIGLHIAFQVITEIHAFYKLKHGQFQFSLLFFINYYVTVQTKRRQGPRA